MAYTVWGAFNSFRSAIIDLDSERTKTASRNYLFEHLKVLAGNDTGFPKLAGNYLPYGSFARNTRIRPLIDIDLLLILNGRGTASMPRELFEYWLRIDDQTAPLAPFADDYNFVNSTKMWNKIKNSLALISNYRKAEIKRTGQAVTLNLQSYDWVFDIVPAVGIGSGSGDIAYYLIPDGSGDYTATDPRIDAANVTRINSQHLGEFLPTIRLLKYWNHRTHKPRLPAYYFEILAVKVFDYATRIESFSKAMEHFFWSCQSPLMSSCPDPKGLGPDLDADIPRDTKQKVLEAMKEAWFNTRRALEHEAALQSSQAIDYRRRVFP